MDYKFLDKVVEQIVSETMVDYDKERVYTPFPPSSSPIFTHNSFLSHSYSPFRFSKHCKEVYGLNEDEVKYVWKKYKETIKDKINNG